MAQKRQLEYNLQKSVCTYLNIQYPKTLYLSDTIASIKLSIPQAVRNKAIQKKGFKCPDLIVLQPSKKYKGLFIELKVESPFKNDGSLKKNEHLEGQQNTIDQLNELGYFASFATGFNEAKEIIDLYLNDE